MISYIVALDNMEIVFGLIIMLVVLVYSAILHEVAHGFVADRLGDPTARLMGRLTLDPRKHIDPIMSFLLPLILIISQLSNILAGQPFFVFGAAKPVPVDTFNLKDGRKDMALVSLVGPGTNFLIAIIAAFLIKLLTFAAIGTIGIYIFDFLKVVIYLNLLLAIFNLLPIPPLDGSKIFALILPEKEARTYLSLGSIGFFIIFFLLMFPIGGFSLGSLLYTLVSFSEKLLGM